MGPPNWSTKSGGCLRTSLRQSTRGYDANHWHRYYLLFTSAEQKLSTFPPGFQMIAGDPNRRNFTCDVPEPPKSSWSGFEVSQEGLSQKAVGFNCLHYESDGKGATTPEPSLGRHYLPDKSFLDSHCTSGIRIELFFPSCWDGEHATSEDHKGHMVCLLALCWCTCTLVSKISNCSRPTRVWLMGETAPRVILSEPHLSSTKRSGIPTSSRVRRENSLSAMAIQPGLVTTVTSNLRGKVILWRRRSQLARIPLATPKTARSSP